MRSTVLLLGSALAVSAALLPLSSCNDANENAVGPTTPGTGAPSQVRGRIPQPKAFLPTPSAAAVAAAEKADLAASRAELAATDVTASAAFPRAQHDPVRTGRAVECFDGAEVTGQPGTGNPFRPQNDASRGCELNTMGHSSGSAAAFAAPVTNPIRGVLLTNVELLDFEYAGGPAIGGAPRWSIPIDDDGDGVFEFQDPDDEQFAAIDALGCNDGDANVGRIRGEDDPTCNVNYKGVNYPNWTAFELAFPSGRIARNFSSTFGNQRADPFVVIDQETHYLVFRFRVARRS